MRMRLKKQGPATSSWARYASHGKRKSCQSQSWVDSRVMGWRNSVTKVRSDVETRLSVPSGVSNCYFPPIKVLWLQSSVYITCEPWISFTKSKKQEDNTYLSQPQSFTLYDPISTTFRRRQNYSNGEQIVVSWLNIFLITVYSVRFLQKGFV